MNNTANPFPQRRSYRHLYQFILAALLLVFSGMFFQETISLLELFHIRVVAMPVVPIPPGA